MIIINSDTTSIQYYSRYNTVDSYTIQDHSSRIVFSGVTNLVAVNGKITHSGLTHTFIADDIYTYKAFYQGNLSNQTLIEWVSDTRTENYKPITKVNNTFVTPVTITGATIDVSYYSRYNQIDRWEILDHNSRVVLTGDTVETAVDGKITQSITYDYIVNGLYTYKAYYEDSLANQSLIKYSSDRKGRYKNFVKEANTFKTRIKDIVITLIDGGSATYVGEILDGGSATVVGVTIINGGNSD